jgi:hypothetical protein
MLADEVNTGKDIARKIVVEDLRKRKICSRFVPHSLNPEEKDRRIAAYRLPQQTVNLSSLRRL